MEILSRCTLLLKGAWVPKERAKCRVGANDCNSLAWRHPFTPFFHLGFMLDCAKFVWPNHGLQTMGGLVERWVSWPLSSSASALQRVCGHLELTRAFKVSRPKDRILFSLKKIPKKNCTLSVKRRLSLWCGNASLNKKKKKTTMSGHDFFLKTFL